MSCPDANELAQLADGTLADNGRRAVESHLDGCPACSELVAELAWSLASDVEAPPGFRITGKIPDRGYTAVGDDGESVELRRVADDQEWLAALVAVEIANVVPVIAAPRAGGEWWVATARTSSAPALDGAAVRSIVTAASALQRRGVIFKALSAANLRRDGAGTIRLDPVCATASPLHYLAPERLHGGPPTRAADQFALCAVLWQAVVGRPPYERETAGALAVAMQTPPTLPADRDPRLLRVLVRGLAFDPAARWPDLDALVAALDAGPSRRLAWATVLAAVVLALIALARC